MSETQLNVVPSVSLHEPLHSKVTNYLNDQRRRGQFCDLIIQLENGYSIYGHFCVIAAQSCFIGGSHFLQKNLKFTIHNPLKVVIKNFDCSVCLQTIGDFFYEDMVTIVKEHEEHFKELAKILSVTEILTLFQISEDKVQILGMTNGNEMEMEKAIAFYIDNDDDEKDENDHLPLNTNAECNGIDYKKTYFKLENVPTPTAKCKINYCLACNFKCYRAGDMVYHMRSCEASHLTCSMCTIGFLNWRAFDNHLKCHAKDMKKPFFCLECDARFMTRASLALHYPKHSKETPHLCSYCGKGFKWKQGLSTHMMVHSNEKPMLCDICGYSASHMKALQSHKVKHAGIYFKCTFPDCHYKANRKENLKMHMETHKKERPFICEVCGCKFSLSKNLKRHALKHSTEEVNKYKCQLCAFASHRSDKLKEHVQRVHTERAVQLELPEVADNSFECNMDFDQFNLPNLNDDGNHQENQDENKKTKKTKTADIKRRSHKMKHLSNINEHKFRTIAPKLIHS